MTETVHPLDPHVRCVLGTELDELLDAVVLTTGQNAYRRRDGMGVVPLTLLGP